MRSRSVDYDDIPAVVAVIEGLPDYFTDDVPAKIERDARSHDAWVVTEWIGGRYCRGGPEIQWRAEILWMAVDAGSRGRGLGTQLLQHVLARLATAGVSVVEAKTLDASSGYQPYEATRAFWERNGFVQVDTIDPLPDWPPGNPAAIYVAALRATVSASG